MHHFVYVMKHLSEAWGSIIYLISLDKLKAFDKNRNQCSSY